MTSRKALKESITAIRELADNVRMRYFDTIPPTRASAPSIPTYAATEALADLYAMDDTLYNSAIHFIDALRKSSTHSEPVEEKIKAIQSNIEEIKSLQVTMRYVLYNAVNNELSQECREGPIHAIKKKTKR